MTRPNNTKMVQVGLINIRGLGLGKYEDLCKELEAHQMDIVGVTETQMRENGCLRSGKYEMFYKGRKKQQTKGGGVGVIVRMEAGYDVEEISVGESEMSEDILAVKVEYATTKNERMQMVMIVCYMTVEGVRSERENREKYACIKKVLDEYSHEMIVVIGDMNGHVGVLGEPVNKNGELLNEFVFENGLENLNVTMAEGKVTWSNKENCSAIDYILVNAKARRKVMCMWVDEAGVFDIRSDHNMLVTELKMHDTHVRELDKKCKWRVKGVDWDNFSAKLTDTEWEVTSDVNGMNEQLKKCMNEAARAACARTTKNKRKSRRINEVWWSSDVRVARSERKRCNRVCRQLRKKRHESEDCEQKYQEAWQRYEEQQRRTKTIIRNHIVEYERNRINEFVMKGERGGRNWYAFLRGDKSESDLRVDGLNVEGVYVTERTMLAEAVKKFWEDIGGMNDLFTPGENVVSLERKNLSGMDEEITNEEVKQVVERMKNNKAAGMDEIPYEMYKYGGESAIGRLTDLFNVVWTNECVPDAWNESRVTLLHKGGHKSKKELRNYRPIALADTSGKIFCAVMNERMQRCIRNERVFGEEQNGFRYDRRAEDNIYVVNELIERMKRDGKKVYLAFLDIEKAYDRVDRELLCQILGKIGMSEKCVRLVRSMYVNTRAKYRLGDIETDWVRSRRGVRQGCILSPLLFNLYTEEMATRVRRMDVGVRVGGERLRMLLYADDAVIMSENSEELQSMLDCVTEYGRDFNVRFSAEKSQVLVVNGSIEDMSRVWMLGGNEIVRTNEYKYLGMCVDHEGCQRTKAANLSKANQWLGILGSAASSA